MSNAWPLGLLLLGLSPSALATQDGALRGTAATCIGRGPIHSPGLSSPAMATQHGAPRATAEMCDRVCPLRPPGASSSALAT